MDPKPLTLLFVSFGKTQKHRNKLQVGHASLVLGSHRMKAGGLQEKLAYLKISSASPTKRAEETAAISLAIRRFGGTRLVCNLPPLPHEFGSRVTAILVGWRKKLGRKQWGSVKELILGTPAENSKEAGQLMYQVKNH